MIPARHSHVSQNKLWEERQVEADEDDKCRQLCRSLRIHPPTHLRPPEVHAGQIRNKHASYHHVVEVRDHEVSCRHVHINADRSEEQSGQSADGKQTDEGQGIEHRRIETNRSLV